MGKHQRKPRFLSEPLPSRGDTPSPSTALESGPHLPPTAQPENPPHSAFPLTPISAIGEGPFSLSRGSVSRSEQIASLNGSHQTEVQSSMTVRATSPQQEQVSSHHFYKPEQVNNNNNSDPLQLSSTSAVMPHRLDTLLIQQRPFVDHRLGAYYTADRPSPPPIATLPQSPSLSSSNSSLSSPGPTVLPSLLHSNHVIPSHYMAGPIRHPHSGGGPYHPHFSDQGTISPPDVFASPMTPYSTHSSHGGTTYDTHGHVATLRSPHSQSQPTYGSVYHHPTQSYGLVYTDDASTKLNERVRRRCFNCCTTDTSTWRRSGLHPGKVLCNKCGLFERTHSRPRPDQFPHKRGPLSMTTFPSKSPPPLPRPSNHQSSAHHERLHQLPQISTQQHHHANVPPNANHPSLSANYTHPNTLPQIQDWLREPIGNGNGNTNGNANDRHALMQNQSQYSPRQATRQQSNGSISDGYHPYRDHRRSPPSNSASQQDVRSVPRTLTPSPSPVLRQASPRTATT